MDEFSRFDDRDRDSKNSSKTFSTQGLTMEQSFRMQTFKPTVLRMNRAQLQEMLWEIMRQKMVQENMYQKMMKGEDLF